MLWLLRALLPLARPYPRDCGACQRFDDPWGGLLPCELGLEPQNMLSPEAPLGRARGGSGALGVILCLCLAPACEGSGGTGGGDLGEPCYSGRPCREGLVCQASRCVTPLDGLCEDVTCSGLGACIPLTADQRACACLLGYHDEQVDCVPNDVIDPCLGVTCQGHGACQVIYGNVPVCVCEAGYHDLGALCVPNDDADPCLGVGCAALGRGVCSPLEGSPQCACAQGLTLVGTSCRETWLDRWWQHPIGEHPPAADDLALAYDASRDRVVAHLIARPDPAGPEVTETWELEGDTWIDTTPAVTPPLRLHYDMVYDATRMRTVLFGGLDANTWEELADTWEYDGTLWTEVTTAHAPSPRGQHVMAYHAGRGLTVLFGGSCRYADSCDAPAYDSVYYSDTWTFDGTDWSPWELPAGSEPTTDVAHALAHDPVRGEVVLLGATRYAGTLRSIETWRLDGAGWRRADDAGWPDLEIPLVMGWDAARSRLVLFGEGSDFRGHTLAFDGASWSRLWPDGSPPVGSTMGLAVDTTRGRLVVLSTMSSTYPPTRETWSFTSTPLSP